MTNLKTLFALKNGESLTADETKDIDAALVKISSADIPDEQVENVVEYLDSNLLYNRALIPISQLTALEKLRTELEARR
jgi:hypothetical protein